MSRYKFTKADCVKGGKSRSKQAAQERRENPSDLEWAMRKLLVKIFPTMTLSFEHPIQTKTNMMQYIDIMVISPDKSMLAIEVDGSHDYHNERYQTSNSVYDEIKARWLAENNIPLLWVNEAVYTRISDFRDEISGDSFTPILKLFGLDW